MKPEEALCVEACLYLQPHMDQTIKPGDWYYYSDISGPFLCYREGEDKPLYVRIPTLPDMMSFARELAEERWPGRVGGLNLLGDVVGRWAVTICTEGNYIPSDHHESYFECTFPTAALALFELIKKIKEEGNVSR